MTVHVLEHGTVKPVVLATAFGIRRPGFVPYVRDNWPVWLRFVQLADMMRAKRSHYSADAIIHVIRWETDLSDNSVAWKINNNHRAGFARLYNAMLGYDFFRTRESGDV